MEGCKSPVQIEDRYSYLHALPNFDELRQPTFDSSFKTASLPEIHKCVSRISNQYLRFVYTRIWSILVYLAYNHFLSVTLGPEDDRQKAGRHLTSAERINIKTLLVGSAESRRTFKGILNQGSLWKDLLFHANCGILLLVKQSSLLILEQSRSQIIEQYISCIDTEKSRSLVCDILSDFSPADRLSNSYYTRAHKELCTIIHSEWPSFADDLTVYRQNQRDLFNPTRLDSQGTGCFEQKQLIHFYDGFVCSTRTLLTSPASNTYLRPLRLQFPPVLSAICALSAMYFKYVVPNNQFAKFNKLELSYYGTSLQYLRNNVLDIGAAEIIVTVCMLLVHYSVCSPDPNSRWLMHASLLCFLQKQGISIDFPEALFIVYQIILTFNPVSPQSANHGIRIDYLLDDDPDFIVDLGASKKILWFIGRVNEVESSTRSNFCKRVEQGKTIETSISSVVQYTNERLNAALVQEIGECYKICVLLMVRCRLLGYTRSHPKVEELVSDLTVRALKLPTGGSSYKAQNPWAVFYFCALLSTGNIRDSLHCRIMVMASKNVTNVRHPLNGLPLLWAWQDANVHLIAVDGWMEDMFNSIPPELQNINLG